MPPLNQRRLSFRNLLSRSGSTLTGRASLNAVASVLDNGARMLVSFVINPILLSGLGDFRFGVWQVLHRLIGYLGPATGRPSQALKWAVANRQSSSDLLEKRRLVGSAVLVTLVFSPIVFALGAVLAWFAPAWLDSPTGEVSSIRVATVVLLLHLALFSFVGIPRSVLEGENLGYKRMGLSALLVIVGGALTGLAVYLDLGLVGVAGATLATTCLTGLLFWAVTRRYVSWFGSARPSRESMRAFFELSGWFLVWNFVMRTMRSDLVILGLFGSAQTVTLYALTRQVPEALGNLLTVVVQAAVPGLGRIVGSEELERMRRLRGEALALVWLLVTAGGATTILWNRSFVTLWVGEVYFAGPVENLLIVLMLAQFVLVQSDAALIDLTLRVRSKVLFGLLSVAMAVVCAAYLVNFRQLGIVGVCLSFMGARLIQSVSYPWLIGRFMGISFTEQLRASLRPALTSAGLLGVAYQLGHRLQVSTWWQLVLVASLTFPVAVFLSLAGMSAVQRSRVVKRLKGLVKRGSRDGSDS